MSAVTPPAVNVPNHARCVHDELYPRPSPIPSRLSACHQAFSPSRRTFLMLREESCQVVSANSVVCGVICVSFTLGADANQQETRCCPLGTYGVDRHKRSKTAGIGTVLGLPIAGVSVHRLPGRRTSPMGSKSVDQIDRREASMYMDVQKLAQEYRTRDRRGVVSSPMIRT